MRTRSSMARTLGVVVVALFVASPALAEAPRDLMVPEVSTRPAILTPTGQAPYNTIFLNRCTNGCTVRPGATDSRVDDSSLVNGTRQLTAFSGTEAQWQTILACVKDTFSVFNVNVTDVDPGSADHFEIMVAGTPAKLGNGTHRGEVTGYDAQGTPGKASVEVIIGPPCTKPSDCSNNTDTCIGGRCRPGADDGSGGGCSTTTGGPVGASSAGLLFALLVFKRRRRA